jgi:membrane protease YdiL (CAAX protease family)
MKKKSVFLFYGIIYFIAMFFIQQLASHLGSAAAKQPSYEIIDPNKVFAPLFVHHIIQMLIALLIIVILKIKYKQDFGFKLGDKKTGFSNVFIFSLLLAVFIFVKNVHDYSSISNIGYNYPLNSWNIVGSLLFQAFMSGPSEEILFRALPITLFIIIFRKSVKLGLGISLEIILAALLFAIAHLHGFKLDFQIYYSFILGIIYGITYQKTESILYPMLMHSISSVLAVGMGYLFYFFY